MFKRLICCLVLIAFSCRSNPPGSADAPAPPATAAAANDPNTAPPDPDADPKPHWIWGGEKSIEGEDRYFRIAFDPKLPDPPKTEDPFSAWIWAACDDEMTIHLNGKLVIRHSGHSTAVLENVRSKLVPGENVISVKCRNNTGPAGLSLKLEIRGPYREEPYRLVTDASWTTSSMTAKGWRAPNFDNAAFVKARIVGDYGMEPYGKLGAGVPSQATSVDNITVPPGFKIELIYNVPKSQQGSWVAMTPDPKGRLYVSDQSGSLYRVTPGWGGQPTRVEHVDLDIGQSQGMLWAFDSLYLTTNTNNAKYNSGLYRLRDTDRDDKLDRIDTLKTFSNRTKDGPAYGEHGPHAVVLSPDKKWLYVVAGNFTDLPAGIARTAPARNWAEDLLLERMTDGKGHDPTIYAPAGWVCRTDRGGKKWESVAVGMRNTYDIAFNHDGELFAFDSDMEWDIGTPWWRPIRVCHVVSGAEFGWRNGSAKFPPYYADSVPSVVDVGMGSPTGVTFGTRAKFPAKYQRAFFISDWTFGKIFAVHMTPSGASYKAEFEPFLVGKPFAVTDCVINADGAMYVTIGGRGTQSGLYRVTYEGSESTARAKPFHDSKSADARKLRHKLESFHGHRDADAVNFAWPHLGSSDRFIRYAARVAIESHDPAIWSDRALAEQSPTAVTNALIALCRVGNSSLQPRILDALARIDLTKLSREQLLEVLRAYELCFIRMGRPADPAVGPGIASRLDKLFPAKQDDVNHELTQLLVHLKSPTVIEKSIALLDKAKTQEEQLFYVFNLRHVRDGWKQPQRETMFKWLNRATQHYTGGASYKLFIKNIREDVIKTLGDNEKLALESLLRPPMDVALDSDPKTPPKKFVKSWTMADLTPKLAATKTGRSFESGKAAYLAVSCAKCHRFNGDGGGSGPDISGIGNRFQPADLLEAIILPSKIISDQYQATEIITKKKEVFVGTIQEENDEKVVVRPSPLATATETVPKKEIAQRRPSKLSIMPQGLIDVLSEDEILDLIAYLRSAGNPKDPAFAQKGATTTASTPPSAP